MEDVWEKDLTEEAFQEKIASNDLAKLQENLHSVLYLPNDLQKGFLDAVQVEEDKIDEEAFRKGFIEADGNATLLAKAFSLIQ